MDKQQKVRESLISLVERTGTKYNFIAKKINISPQLLHNYKKGKNLGQENLENLESYLKDTV